MMVAAAKKFRDGGAAIGTQKEMPYASLASYEGVVPKTTDWRALGVPAAGTVPAK
jgi:phthalate 4,5-dioxygenase oxygenase subunit